MTLVVVVDTATAV